MTWTDADTAAEARYRQLAERPLDPQALGALLAALSDESWRVRSLAAERLSRVEASPATVSQLVTLLADRDNPGARNAAAAALAQLGAVALPALEQLLRHDDADQRKFAADILGELHREEAVPALITAVDDADANVRGAAAEALGRIGGLLAVRALEQLLDSTEPLLRVCALEGLAAARRPPALPRLVPHLADPLTRRSAFRLLGLVEHPAALARLCQALRLPATRDAALLALAGRLPLLAADVEAELRLALRSQRDVEAWLRGALESDDAERRLGALHLCHALEEPGLAEAVVLASTGSLAEPALRALHHLGVRGAQVLLQGEPPRLATLPREVRTVAFEAVVAAAGPALVPALTRVLAEGDQELSEFAARALGRSSAKEAIAPLIALFSDDLLAVHAWRALVLLATAWPREVEAALEGLVAGALQPHALRAWAQVAGTRALDALRRGLRDAREAVRGAAAESAGAVGEGAAALLREALLDESPRVRRAAARALGALPQAEGLPLLHVALGDLDASVLAVAVHAAAELGALDEVPRLKALCQHDDAGVVLGALETLSLLAALDDAELEAALAHDDAEVFKLALTLGADRELMIGRATDALTHPRWDVRVAAARGLAVAGSRDSLAMLHRAIEREADPIARELLLHAEAQLAQR